MESRSDVVIISAFGRGIWLALELAKQFPHITFVDVSEKLGHSQPEDWNGPFPLFKTTQFDEAQWKFLSDSSTLETVENGFTFWLSSGPWELKGPLFQFLRKKHGIDEEAIRYIQDFHSISEPERRVIRHRIQQMTGRENWPAYFAHQIASSVYNSERNHLEEIIPLAIFSPAYVRKMNRETINSNYEKLRKAGIKLFLDARLEDLSVQGRSLDGIEIKSERSGIIPGKKFIWMLTGEETRRFNSRVLGAIFGEGVVESSWCWVRFLVRIGESAERDVLPHAFAMAKDIHLPWTHANLSFAEQTETTGVFRIWMRVASGRRFQRSYMTEMGDDLVKELRRRIPAVTVEIEQMPPEFHFGYEELGPPRYPVLLKSEVKKLTRTRLKNVHYVSPEDWGGLDWGTRMSIENRAYFLLSSERREETKNDRALHPT